ncbi:hypothetical protein [Sphingobacterium corticibacterium]|uniref:Uncharacterized protein n=1 Tax=Sphingobacterium corticibacterium TaxID=2484746 RepID=A0A4Q6XHC7_9SPHI|nr:hypothetical protein [Sphingobacterium corticibacterium]RZF59311.1 hypothetical protein EWE74_09005 [Sphingobacterium corticibacterium]
MMRLFFTLFLVIFFASNSNAQLRESKFIFQEAQAGDLALVDRGSPLSLHFDLKNDKVVLRAVENRRQDFEMVAGRLKPSYLGPPQSVQL